MAMAHGAPRNGGLAFLSVLASLSMGPMLPSVGATLTFQRNTDMLGFASTFAEGTGLPSRNFTLSATVRSSSGREWFHPFQEPRSSRMGLWQWGSSVAFDFDDDSLEIDLLPNNQSVVEELLMSMRTWTVTYDDAAQNLTVYIDTVQIGGKILDRPPFPAQSIFGPNAVRSLFFGGYYFPQYDAEGAVASLDPMADIYGLYGQLDDLQLWDRALNSSEIAQTAAFPNSLTGDEEGLCVFWRADQGYGGRVSNLGSTGAQYDGVLGRYAVGRHQTSSALGLDCWDGASMTSPVWVNKTVVGKNALPIADNMTIYVRTKWSSDVTSAP